MSFLNASFTFIGRLNPKSDWKMAAHHHPFHELIVVVGGRLAVEIDGKTIEAGAGELVWYPQEVNHKEWTYSKEPAETFFLVFRCPDFRLAGGLHLRDTLGRIEALARWLYAEREAHAAAAITRAENAFFQAVLAECHRLSTCNESPVIIRVRAYMRQRLATPISLDDLAACARTSKYHFIRQYKAITGRTPMQDLRRLRLLAARDLLLTTNLPLKEIAPRTGLGDEYHLSRLFQSHFNTSPGTLRRKLAGN